MILLRNLLKDIIIWKKEKNFTKISFYLDNAINFNNYIKYKPNIITCQFGLHYFDDLNLLFYKITNTLDINGFFLGIVPDGDIIEELLNNPREIENVYLNKINDKQYCFKLIDNKNDLNYFNFRETDYEYFVKKIF